MTTPAPAPVDGEPLAPPRPRAAGLVTTYMLFSAIMFPSALGTATLIFGPDRAGTIGGLAFLLLSTALLHRLGARLDARHRDCVSARSRMEAQLGALRESEARLRDLAQASGDWMWETDGEGRYTWASDSIRTLLDVAPAEVVGRTPFELMPPAEAARVSELFAEIAAGKRAFRELENTVMHRSGRLVTVATTGVPILGPSGELCGYRGFDRDITDRKRDEEELRRLADHLSAILDTVPDLLFEVDAEGQYLAVRASHEDLLAAPLATLIGRSVAEVLPPAAAQVVAEALVSAAAHGRDYGRVITLPVPSGVRRFELSVAAISNPEEHGQRFVVLSRDVTAREEAEAEIRARNAELERFNRASIGRELDIVALKKEVNDLARRVGEEPRYILDFLEEAE